MARYRERDEVDLRWNAIRRRITRELDTQIMEWREDALNKLLSEAWRRYAASLEAGEIIELQAEYEEWVGTALEQSIKARPADAPV